jgi:hypothetical protein
MRSLAPRLLRPYLWALGCGLLAQGVLTIAFLAFTDDAARLTHGLLNHDAAHGGIHVAWGLAIVTMLRKGVGKDRLAWVAVVFGLFYLALAVLGVAVHDPFGLQLGPGENGFHFLVGPSALLVGGLALWAQAGPAEPGLAPRLGDR